MVSRWDVERALRWSNLRPMARLVAYALLTKVSNDNAVIPPEHSPSVSTIAAITGMSRSVAAEQLSYLEELDWLKRMSPGKASRYDRNNYALKVGRPDPNRASSPGDGPLAQSAVRDTDGSRPAEMDSAVRQADGSNGASSPGDGLPVVRDTDGSERGSSPGAGHASTTHLPKTTTKEGAQARAPRRKAAPRAEPLFSDDVPTGPLNAGQILRGWIDYCRSKNVRLPSQLIGHYAKQIDNALKDDFTDRQIRLALASMFSTGDASSPSTLAKRLVDLQGPPKSWPARESANGRAGSGPYINPDEAGAYDSWKTGPKP